MVNIQDFKNYHYYKYVVFADGQILFGEVDRAHTCIRNGNVTAIGAGKIKYNEGCFSFDEKGSFTLNLKEACQEEVREFLEGLGIKEAEGEAFY